MTEQLSGAAASLQKFLDYLAGGIEAARDEGFDAKEYRAKLQEMIEGIYEGERPTTGVVALSPRTMNAPLRAAWGGPSDGHSIERLERFLDFIASRLAATDYGQAESLLHEAVCPHHAARRASERAISGGE